LKKFFGKRSCEESTLYNRYHKACHVFQKNLIFIASTSGSGIKNIFYKLVVISHIDKIYIIILNIFNAKKMNKQPKGNI